ncbi:MAG TPA: hypothetical protein VNZ43_10500 [Sphingomonadaceae bacterium]|nr:hypothetical protein [Sphingomonadaceae bacterium]
MKKMAAIGVLLVLGLGVGGGASLATDALMAERQARAEQTLVFVPTGTILAPLVFPDGRLSGYVSFEAQIEVPSDRSNIVKTQLPLLLDAINMRTYRTPMASGPDGMVPGLDAFRRLLLDAAIETYGKAAVRRVVVTQATPA